MRETFVIVNPGARRGRGAAATLRRALPHAEVHRSHGQGDARALARRAVAHGFTTIVAAGGDGTINEVLNGIGAALDRVRLGVLPLGTGNDFARAIGVPAELEPALEVLRAGRTSRADVVSFRDGRLARLFLNVSAAGFSGAVDGSLTPAVKRQWGPLAYVRAAFDVLGEQDCYDVTLRFDDGDEVRESGFNLAVANARWVAGGVPIAPEARIDDGLFDVVLVRSCTLPALAALAPRIALGLHLDDPQERVLFRRARTLDVSARPSMPLNVDGELLGARGGRYEVMPRALEVVVGPEAPALG